MVFMVIDPELCIDCSLCKPACPIDAIVETEDEDPEWAVINADLSPQWADNEPLTGADPAARRSPAHARRQRDRQPLTGGSRRSTGIKSRPLGPAVSYLAPPVDSRRVSACRDGHRNSLTRVGSALELQHQLDHVVLAAVGVGAVARDRVLVEARGRAG